MTRITAGIPVFRDGFTTGPATARTTPLLSVAQGSCPAPGDAGLTLVAAGAKAAGLALAGFLARVAHSAALDLERTRVQSPANER